jgi:hypothetical protein
MVKNQRYFTTVNHYSPLMKLVDIFNLLVKITTILINLNVVLHIPLSSEIEDGIILALIFN